MHQELWPKLDLILSIDYRWSTTALHSDIVFPAAFHHEKAQFDSMVSSAMRFLAYCDRTIPPRHNTKPELRIVEELVLAMERRARERGLDTYEVPHGMTVDDFNRELDMENTTVGELSELPEELEARAGTERSYQNLWERIFAQRLPFEDEEPPVFGQKDVDTTRRIMENIINDCTEVGLFDEEETFEDVRERGFAKYEGLGEGLLGINQAAEVESDKTIAAFTEHVRNHKPYPTLTGRAQFYIDHEWFLEADEHLPVHKSPPASHGGDREQYPYFITSGHNRHSTHGCTLANETQMNMHRGEPHLFINRTRAEKLGIEDGDRVRIFNDFGSFVVQAKRSSQPQPDQLIIYHAWDSYLFEEGQGHHMLTPGLIKPLFLAGDYGHFEYSVMNWQPQQVDRHVSVDVEPLDGTND